MVVQLVYCGLGGLFVCWFVLLFGFWFVGLLSLDLVVFGCGYCLFGLFFYLFGLTLWVLGIWCVCVGVLIALNLCLDFDCCVLLLCLVRFGFLKRLFVVYGSDFIWFSGICSFSFEELLEFGDCLR